MTTVTTALAPADLERLIDSVRGVHAARVVVGQSNQIDEIHVVGTPGRSAKQIVRDIESILYVRGGVRVDHRKISLVQIADAVVQPLVPRVEIVAVAPCSSDEGPAVIVTLRLCDQQVQGVGTTRPGQKPDLPLLAAYGTIHALGKLLGPRGQMHLERLQRQPFGALEVYLSQIAYDTDETAETLLGISPLCDDELLAVARAVLDAVNRRVQRPLADSMPVVGR